MFKSAVPLNIRRDPPGRVDGQSVSIEDHKKYGAVSRGKWEGTATGRR